MNEITQGLLRALQLIISLDPAVLQVVALSLFVSGGAVVLAACLGIPLGAWLALHRFRGSGALVWLLEGLMGLPPVVAGLVIYLLFSRSGAFGALDLLYTPSVMILAQFVLALPIVAALSRSAIAAKDRLIRETAQTLGASPRQIALTVIREARVPIAGAILAGFGRALAEVGAVMIVGGNIEGSTRVMTTAIVLETRRGAFDEAIALGVILLVIAFVVSSLLRRLGGEAT